MTEVGRRMSDVGDRCVSESVGRRSDVRRRTSGVGCRTSEIRYQTSDARTEDVAAMEQKSSSDPL